MQRFARGALAIVLAAVFAAAAVMKVSGGPEESVLNSFAPPGTVPRVALILVELGIAGWLLSGVRRWLAASVAFLLLATFTGVLVAELTQPAPQPCGCFAALQAAGSDAVRQSLWWGIGGNGMMLGLAAILFAMEITRPLQRVTIVAFVNDSGFKRSSELATSASL